MASTTHCPYCGRLTDPKLENCPHCGNRLIRGIQQAGAGSPRPTCPSCHAPVQAGDIICVGCGTNLLTGQKIAEERKRPAAEKDKHNRHKLLAGGAAALLLIAAGIFVAYLLMRDPVEQAVKLAKAGKYLEASNVLSKCVERTPKNARAHFELGKCQWSLNQFVPASDSFEEASRLDPKNREAGMLAVVSLASIKDPPTRDRQITVLKRVVQEYPDDAQARYLLALELGAQGDVAGEIEALETLVNLDPANARTHESLAVARASQKDYEGAEKELQEAAQHNAALDPAALGFVAYLGGKQEEAVEHLRRAVEAGSSVKNEALTRLGLLLAAQGRFKDAQDYLTQAVKGEKDNADAQFFRAVCYQAGGMGAEALKDFGAVAQTSGPLAAEAALRTADLYLSQGETEKAREAMEKAASAGLRSPGLNTVRGRISAASGQLESARADFNKEIEADPDYAPAYLENGLLYIKQQLFGDAIEQLEHYLELMGTDVQGAPRAEIEILVNQLKQAGGVGRRLKASGQGPSETQATVSTVPGRKTP